MVVKNKVMITGWRPYPVVENRVGCLAALTSQVKVGMNLKCVANIRVGKDRDATIKGGNNASLAFQ